MSAAAQGDRVRDSLRLEAPARQREIDEHVVGKHVPGLARLEKRDEPLGDGHAFLPFASSTDWT
jgi:hypothetical protein